MKNKKPSIFEIYGQVHNENVKNPTTSKKNPYSPISVGKRYDPKIVNGKFSLHESIDSSSDKPLATEVKRHFLEIISTYKAFQEQMQRQSDIVDVAETLGGIVEAAKTLTLSEAGDWFDKVTIKRNMNELEKLDKAFDKVAVEARALDERLHALYEDMGNILNRYYEISDIDPNTMKERLGMRESVNEFDNLTAKTVMSWYSSDIMKGLKKYGKNPKDIKKLIQLIKDLTHDAELDLNENVKKKSVNEGSQYDLIVLEPNKGRDFYQKVVTSIKSTKNNASISAGRNNHILVNRGDAKKIKDILDDKGIKVVRYTEDGKGFPLENKSINEFDNLTAKTVMSWYSSDIMKGLKKYGKNPKDIKKLIQLIKDLTHDAELDLNENVKKKMDEECGCSSKTINENVANTILKQLGGNKFLAMTGAKNLASSGNSLSFKLPKAKGGINHVKITLTSKDLYDIDFGSFRGVKYVVKKNVNDVFAEDLPYVFTKYTGLYTSL